MNLWGLKIDDHQYPIALRTRALVQEWPGQRFMGSGDYKMRAPNWSAVWKKVRENHPGARIVRVTVSERGDA